MNVSYEFLTELRRLWAAYRRFESAVYLLNAAILSILFYDIALFIGLSAFFRFYWPDIILLAEAPAIFSLILGVIAAVIIKRRTKSSFFECFEHELSEQVTTAYDNRYVDSIVMQSLAEDVKRRLSAIGDAYVFDWRQLKLRSAAVVILVVSTAIIGHSENYALASPEKFQKFIDIVEEAGEILQGGTESEAQGLDANTSGGIYGKPSLAVLSDEVSLQLEVYPGSGAGYLFRESEPGEHLFIDSEPGEGVAIPSELYIESLPPEHREIIKSYFTLLG